MANEERTGILHFEIDQKDAFTKLETLKKLIIQNKQEQDALKKAFKEGSITIQEYSKESVRLETILKKNQSEYGQLQKSVTGVKTSLDKLIESNKKISDDLKKTSQSFQDAAKDINIAGVNVGSLTTKIASFANPATAAVGIVTALGAAYARSTIGAKDLEFAQNQLAIATTIATNKFASYISSAEDGEGAVTQILNRTLTFISKWPAFAVPRGILGLVGIDIEETRKEAKELALILEDLEDLQRHEIELRTDANERLSENQELLTEIQSDQTKYNDKLTKTDQIIENIRKNQILLTNEKANELALTNKQLEADQANENILNKKNKILKELSSIEKDSEKRIQNVTRLQNNLKEAEAKRLKEIQRNPRLKGFEGTQLETSDVTGGNFRAEFRVTADEIANKQRIQSATNLNKALIALDKQRTRESTKEAGERRRAEEAADQAKLQSATIVSGAIAGLAAEGSAIQRGLTLTSIAFDTAAALTGGIKAAQSIPYPGNLVAMATTIATILGNIAAAKQALTGSGFSEGGYTGDGPKYKPAGVVHAGEVVWSQADVAKAGGAEAVNRMRPTYRPAMKNSGSYADGGLVTNVSTNAINQQMIIANALKNLPPSVVGIVELNRVQKRVDIKQSTAKIGGKRNA